MSSYQNAFLESEQGLSMCLRLAETKELLPFAKSLPSVIICSPLIEDCVNQKRLFTVGQRDLWQARKTENKTYG